LGYIVALVIYLLSGGVGTALAVSLVARVKGWFPPFV
jgi:hypothetical protein